MFKKLLLTVPLVLAINYTALGSTIYYNSDFENTSGQSVNGVTLGLTSYNTNSIGIQNQFQCVNCSDGVNNAPLNWASSAFNSGEPSNNNSQNVTISWDGASVANGKWTHIGIESSESFKISSSNWTINNIPVATFPALTPVFTGSSNTWLVVEANVYADANKTNLVAEIWAEGQGTSATLLNWVSGSPTVYYTVSTFIAPSPFSLQDLNGNFLVVQGNGDFGAPVDGGAVYAQPIPAAIWLVASGLGVLGLFGKRKSA